MPKTYVNMSADAAERSAEREADEQLVQSGLYQTALQKLPNPRDIPQILSRKDTPSPGLSGGPFSTFAAHPRRDREQWFARQVEDAYYNNRGTLPVEWFLKQHEEDLKFFSDPGFTPDIGERLLQNGMAAYYARQRQSALEAEAEAIYQNTVERSTFTGLFSRSAGAENREMWMEEVESAKLEGKDYRQIDLDQAMGVDTRSDLHRDWDDFVSRAIKGGTNFVSFAGTVFEKLALVPGLLLSTDQDHLYQFFGADISESVFGYVPTDSPEIAAARQELEIMRSGSRDRELKDAIAADALPFEVWNQLQEASPEMVQEYVDMYGDMAYMGFAIEFQDKKDDPTIDEQLDTMLEQGVLRPLEENLDYLAEANFRSSSDVLNFLNAYGRVTMGAAATAVTTMLALTDEDEREMLGEIMTPGFWTEIAQDVESGGFTPAGVLGLEGTFAGLLTDYLGGALFDPTTWFFGPRARVGANAVSNPVALETVMRSPGMRMYMRGLPDILAGQGRTTLGKASVLAPYAEVGLDMDILAAVGISDSVFPAQKWINTALGQVAEEVDINMVQRLLDDAQRTQIGELNTTTVDNLSRSLQNQGFNEPLTLSYNSLTGQVYMDDGLKRLAAAAQIDGAKKVPVVVRHDSPGPVSPAWTEIFDNPDAFIYHGTNRLTPDVLAAMERGEAEFTRGGLTTSPKRAESYASETRPISGSHQSFPGAEPMVLVFRREDLPLSAQGKLRRGEDVEELFPTGDFTAYDPIRPVASYPVSEGMPRRPRPGGVDLASLGATPPRRLPTIPVGRAQFVRPSELFGPELIGRVSDPAAVQAATRKGLAMGMDSPGARQSWAAIGLGQIFRKSAGVAPARNLVPYFTSTFNSNYLPVGGVGGMKRLFEQVQFLSASDPVWAGQWMQRFLENRRALGAYDRQIVLRQEEMTQLRLLERELQRRAQSKNGWAGAVAEDLDELLTTPDGPRPQNLGEAHERVMRMLDDQQRAIRTEAAADSGAIEWQELVTEFMEDFNRRHIATHPQWADFVDSDGMVPWNQIHRGSSLEEAGFLSSKQQRGQLDQIAMEREVRDNRNTVVKAELTTRYDPQSVIDLLRRPWGDVPGVELPATPVELLAATTRGGVNYTRWTQEAWGTAVRQSVHLADAMWKANVLATPRTFAVMSLDELNSFAGELGFPFISRYLNTRANMWDARLRSFFTGEMFRAGPGSRFLSQKAVERIRTLQDVPQEFRMYEKMLAEHVNNQTIYLERGNPGYQMAAQQYAQQYLENPAWRTYLGGPEPFRQWFENSMEGETWRLRAQVKYVDEATGEGLYRPFRDWKEAYDALDMNWRIMERQAVQDGLKKPHRFRQAWEETAAMYSQDPSGRTYNLPQWTYDYFGPIPGNRPVYPGASLAWSAASRIFEVGAANPAAFRQGLVAQLMRENETARLNSLFKAQGRPVVSDLDVMQELANRGLPPSAFDSMNSEWLDMDLARTGIFTESYVARLAEQRARDFVNDMTYSFEQGSRAGRIGTGVFPFGRAWGDMYARWGRSLMSRAVLRPWTQKLGFAGQALQKFADFSPINPRTFAKVSRIAALDFDVTGGLIGERETDLDFSPLTFLPTSGDGGLSVLIPGLGPVGIPVLDKAIDIFGPDPVEDPQGYQALIDAVSELVPGISLHGRDLTARTVGSGNIGLLLNSLVDISMGLFHNPNRRMGRLTGDIGLELQRSRAVSAEYADPETMELILEQTDPEVATLLMAAVWRDANKRTSGTGLMENFSRWLIPVRGALDTSLDELYGVWVSAARNAPTMFGIEELNQYTDEQLQRDPELLKSLGDDIRRTFYNLAPWQRELLVATNPTLAVNMIGTWEWSDTAPSDLPDRDRSYQVTGGTADTDLSSFLDRHNIYVQRGWVVPRDTALRGHEIIGRVITARQNSARTLYESTAQQMNELRWEALVSDETKETLEFALSSRFFEPLGITDPYVLWTKWASQRDLLLDDIYEQMDIDPNDPENEDTVDEIRGLLRIPEEEEAWSTEWRGDDVNLFSSERARAFPIALSEEAAAIAEGLGLRVTEGMDGEEFIQTLIAYRASTESGAWNAVRYNYSAYQDERGRSFAVAEGTLHDLTQNPALDSDWRGQLENFVAWASNMSERSYNEGELSREVQDSAIDQFNRLATSGRDVPVNWDKIWRDGFQNLFGPRDWTPPVPPSPFTEDGILQPEAWKPYVRDVVDGDTLMVSLNKGPSFTGGPLRLELDEGETRMHKVRLLGLNAIDYSENPEQAEVATRRLRQALVDAEKRGDEIYLVRDPEYVGTRTDPFGRELAWLWIGDEPFYFPEELERGS